MSAIDFARRRPLSCYFGLTYLVSGLALAVIGLPKLHSSAGRPVMSLVMFPVMVVGVGLIGIGLTAVTGGAEGLRGLRDQFRRPVVDSLGAASPHGPYWPEFFAAFIALLAAVRVLIAWTYVRTGSLRMAQ